jgi:hypothetical protein
MAGIIDYFIIYDFLEKIDNKLFKINFFIFVNDNGICIIIIIIYFLIYYVVYLILLIFIRRIIFICGLQFRIFSRLLSIIL